MSSSSLDAVPLPVLLDVAWKSTGKIARSLWTMASPIRFSRQSCQIRGRCHVCRSGRSDSNPPGHGGFAHPAPSFVVGVV